MRDINELYQGTQAECMKHCLRLKYTKKECEEHWCTKYQVTQQDESHCGCSKKSKETADEEEFEMQLKNKKKLTESIIKKFRFGSK